MVTMINDDRMVCIMMIRRAFVIQHYLPIVFAVALAWALAFPAPGKAVAGVMVRYRYRSYVVLVAE